MVPSSSGLGHGPLKAKTRVQISLESPIIKKPHNGAFLLLNDDLRFERVEFERIVGERNFKKREPYDAKGAQFEKLGIYQSRWNHQ